jgi:hypothetical protein
MEIQEISRLIQDGRYRVDAGLVAEAIVNRLRPPEIPPPTPQDLLPQQLQFDPRSLGTHRY